MGLKFVLIPLALAAAAYAQPPASPCSNTPAYSPCELTFDLSDADAAAHPNPYLTVDLKVEFRSPRHHTLAVPGYWDGGHKIAVRFSPTEAGDWDYLVTSNITALNGKTGAFNAASGDPQGFFHPENMHHWMYTEKTSAGLYQGHLWMGATEMLFATMPEADFRAMADARAAQKFTHLRGLVMSQQQGAAFSSPDSPDAAYFQRLDSRVRYLNQKGVVVDLILAGGANYLTKLFPTWEQRRRFIRYVAGRYSAMNITWQGFDRFEDYPDGRAVLKEIGAVMKQSDPYQHPRTTGSHATSTALLDDGWEDFGAQGRYDDSLGAIEHQVYPVPFVNLDLGREDSGAGKTGPDDVDAATLRHRIWNATMNGQSPTYANTGSGAQYVNSPGAKAMTVWYDLMSQTRHWELEPYYDIDGGRALSLEGVEYVAYIEKPGPIELSVVHHGYDVFWINPIDGTVIKKKYSGEHFTGEPPDRSHDWLLHVVREGHMASMNKSYKFDSREYPMALQEVETNSPKVPFAIEQPAGDLALSRPVPYSVKMIRDTRATRTMMWLWIGDVADDHQGYRVLATSQKGEMRVPQDIAFHFPALMHLRLYGLNANGKLYELDAANQIIP